MNPLRLLPFPLCFALLGCALFPAIANAAPAGGQSGYEYFQVGNVTASTPDKTHPGLMLMGGGTEVDPAFKWFAAQAGHGHVVILGASGKDELQQYMYHDIGGVASVQTLTFHSREAASDPRVLAIVRHADGIFFRGGDQAKYVRFWKGTPLNDALNAHVRAGKPMGGTSAGLAILGRYSYGALDGGSITSPEALADPMGPAVTLVGDFLKLPPLYAAQVITDSHFDTRDRIGRLLAFVANLAKTQHSASIVGLGIDENTALCIGADGVAHFFSGHPGGQAFLVVQHTLRGVEARGGREALDAYLRPRVVRGKPLDLGGYDVTVIGTDSTLRLPALRVSHPDAREIMDVRDGKLSTRKVR